MATPTGLQDYKMRLDSSSPSYEDTGYHNLTAEEARAKLIADANKGVLSVFFEPVLIKVKPKGDDMMNGHHGLKYSTSLPQAIIGNVRDGMQDQVVLTMGRSGAGKTTTVKELLRQVTYDRPEIQRHLGESLNVLRLFTNAPTQDNSDSTRCIFKVQVHFFDMRPNGFKVELQALEATRVLQDTARFKILEELHHSVNGGLTEGTRQALGSFLAPEEVEELVKWLRAILLLRNIEIPAHEDDQEGLILQERLRNVASPNYLGCDLTMLSRSIDSMAVPGGGWNPIDISERKHQRDGFLVRLYTELCHTVVQRLNEKMRDLLQLNQDEGAKSTLTIIDIPGSEDMIENRLEQFIINWINEWVQQQAAEIVVDRITARDPNAYMPSEINQVPPTFLSSTKIAMKMNNLTQSREADVGMWVEELRKLSTAIVETESQPGVITLKHYSGNISYSISGFFDTNTLPMPKHTLSLIATILHQDSAGSTSSTHTFTASTMSMLKALKEEIGKADSKWIVCCVRDVTDRDEIAHMNIVKYLTLLFPKYSISMPTKAFEAKYEHHLESGVEGSSIGALVASMGFGEDTYQIVKDQIFLTRALDLALNTRLANGQDDDDDENDISVVISTPFNFGASQDPMIRGLTLDHETLQEEYYGLQSKVDNLNSTVADLEALGQVRNINIADLEAKVVVSNTHIAELEIRVMDSNTNTARLEALVAVRDTNVADLKDEVGVQSTLINDLKGQLGAQSTVVADLRDKMRVKEEALALAAQHKLENDQIAAARLVEINTLKKKARDKESELETANSLYSELQHQHTSLQVGLTDLQSSHAIQTKSLDQATLALETAERERAKEERRLLTEIEHVNLAADIQRQASQTQIRQLEQERQAYNTQRDAARDRLFLSIQDFGLARFALLDDGQNTYAKIKRVAEKLKWHLAPFYEHPKVYTAVKQGVEKSGASSLPASTILPLLHVLALIVTASADAPTGATGLDTSQWIEIRDNAIEQFQQKFASESLASLRASASTINATTVVGRIAQLIIPILGMDDLPRVLIPPVSMILSEVMDKRDNKYPKVTKQVVSGRVEDLIANHKETADLSWLRDYL